MYIGFKKDLLLPRDPLPIYYDYKLIINGSTGTYLFTTISWDPLMIWLIFVRVLSISLIHNFLPILNLHFPQKERWQLCHLSNQMNTTLTSALFNSPSEMALVRRIPSQRMRIGEFGIPIVKSLDLTPSSNPVNDPIPHLTIFAQRYPSGEIAPKKKPVSADYVLRF